jgi:hypothetical protein
MFHHRELGPLDAGGNEPSNLEALCVTRHAQDSGAGVGGRKRAAWRQWASGRGRRLGRDVLGNASAATPPDAG